MEDERIDQRLDAQDLFASLALDEAEAEPAKRDSLPKQVLLTIGLFIGSVATLLGLIVLAWNTVIFTQAEQGSCLFFDSSQCRSLTVETIETSIPVSLPDDSEVLSSGSSGSLKSTSQWALVRIDGDEQPSFQGFQEIAASELESHRFDDELEVIDQAWKWALAGSYAEIVFGENEHGDTVVSLYRFNNL